MKVLVDGVVCPVDSILSPADFTSSMRRYCLLWTASDGRVGVHFNGNYWATTCSASTGRSLPPAGRFRLGGEIQHLVRRQCPSPWKHGDILDGFTK